MSKFKPLLFVCLGLYMSFVLPAQVVITPTSGCAPLSVSFSAPAGAANWNFGDGGQSTFNSTSNLYTQSGTFVATYSGVAGNVSQTIVVYANNVTAAFNYNVAASGCLPRQATFTSTSNSPGNVYTWVFADGGQGTGSTITYSYTIAGSFNPTLTVTNTLTGCQAFSSAGPIVVSAQANLVIDPNPSFGSCQAPFTAAFTATNSSTGSPLGGGLTYQWNLGNSQTSNLPSTGPVTYNQGVYTLTLTATDNNNCVTQKTEQVNVTQPTLSVTTPSILCILPQDPNPLKIQSLNIQSSESYVTIDMGDGSPPITYPSPPLTLQTAPNFTYTDYTTPGLKTRTLTVANGTCVATVINTVIVEEIVPMFTTAAPNYTCSPTLIKNYVNQTTVNTTSPLSYTWGATPWYNAVIPAYTTTLTNPTFTFSQGSLNPYAYYGTYRPIVNLAVTSAVGCFTAYAASLDSIHRPTAWFNKNKRQGCAPLAVKFTDSTDTYSVIYPVQSYTWNNGATPATLISGVIPPPMVEPTFTYSSPGTYTPFLMVTTAGGCTDVSFVDTVIVVNPPPASVVFTPNLVVCAGTPVTVNLQATPSNSLISHWHVESDNGFFSGCVSDPSPTWAFTHPGVHGFTLSAYDHGCGSTQVSVQTVTVSGPVGKMRYRTNCANKLSVDFFSYLNAAQSATLDFGDNSPVLVLAGNPSGTMSYTTTHVYPNGNNFVALLTSVNGGCTFQHSVTVTVRQVAANFTMAPAICRNTCQVLDASSSVDVQVGCQRGYAWFIDNDPPVQTDGSLFLTDTMTALGTHTVHLWLKDENGCTDEITKTFRVAAPDPQLGFVANPLCVSNNPAQILNLTPQMPDAVNNYTLFFGTGPSASVALTGAGFPVTHTYGAAVPSSNYTLMLVAKSVLGCIDSVKATLKVNNPNMMMVPTTRKLCVGQQVTFAVSPGYTTIVNFGDGPAFTNTIGPNYYIHSYTTPGTYSASFTATDDGNCTSTASTTLSVQPYPVAEFTFAADGETVSPLPVFCKPVINFTSSILPANLTYTYNWTLGNGSPIINSSVVTGYYTSGTYTVSLIATTSNGCSDTVRHVLTISNPTAVPHVSKTRFCFGETIQVSLSDSSEVSGWKWFFPGGPDQPTINASPAPTGSLSYTFDYYLPPSGAGTIKILYFGTAGVCKQFAEIPVQMIKVDPDFKRNLELTSKDYQHCVNESDQFTNRSQVNGAPGNGGLSYAWNFGNGVTSQQQHPSYIYPEPGSYSVSLTITDALAGCTGTAVKGMTIFPLPTVTVSATDSVCRGGNFILNSEGTSDIAQYQWQPVQGLSSPQSASTTATAQESTSYTLSVVSINGCKGSSTKPASVFIQQPPDKADWDTTVIVGQPTQLNSYQGQGFTYSWTPPAGLSCSTCPYPVTGTTVSATFSVEVSDPMGCFRVVSVHTVNVDPLTSVDVPTAFTPNGDGVNDVIYVDGWGIKRLNFFRIFNRWGQLLYESSDLKQGWDGTYLGVPQNMETYIYQVSVDTYIEGRSLEKTSSFRLIR